MLRTTQQQDLTQRVNAWLLAIAYPRIVLLFLLSDRPLQPVFVNGVQTKKGHPKMTRSQSGAKGRDVIQAILIRAAQLRRLSLRHHRYRGMQPLSSGRAA